MYKNIGKKLKTLDSIVGLGGKGKKILIKTLALSLIVIMLFGMSIIAVSAETTSEYEYTVENGVATITNYIGDSENVIVPSTIDGYEVKSITATAFRNDKANNIKSVVVSEGIENIEDWIFTSCKELESITLPSTVNKLATDWFFIGNKKLKEFKISDNNPRYYVKDGVLYDSQKNSLMLCPSQNIFENGEYKILDGTKDIRSWAFSNCETLKKVIMPDSVTSIGDSSFSECSNLKEIVLSKNINTIGYNSFGNLISLKQITIPKTVTGFYYNGSTTNCSLGYNFGNKIPDFTIKGYRNSEAEKYANDNGFKFIALDEQVDYSKYNPIDFLGMSFGEITNTFGNDYTEIEERESGMHKIICYPNTGNPFEFGFDNDTDLVKCVWTYDLTDNSIKLFDDITNKSTLEDIEKSTTSFTYSKWVGENVFDDNNIEQSVTYQIYNGLIVNFTWTFNDFNKQSANRVLVMQSEVEETTTVETTTEQTSTNPVNNSVTNPTSSTDITSQVPTSYISTNDTATKDSINTDNGIIQTGAISITVIIFLFLASFVISVFAWYRRKTK